MVLRARSLALGHEATPTHHYQPRSYGFFLIDSLIGTAQPPLPLHSFLP